MIELCRGKTQQIKTHTPWCYLELEILLEVYKIEILACTLLLNASRGLQSVLEGVGHRLFFRVNGHEVRVV